MSAGALVLKEPLEFFEKEEKLAWLRSKVQEAGGGPKTVDARRPSARQMHRALCYRV